jgi:hypothetical protein
VLQGSGLTRREEYKAERKQAKVGKNGEIRKKYEEKK